MFFDSLADPTLLDRELLQRFVERQDEHAFSILVRRHGPMVLRACRRVLGNEQDAEDAMQATFLVLARKAASRRWENSIANWLYTVAYRLALAARASACRRKMLESTVPQRVAYDPLADISLREAEALVDEELARIPERYRAAVVLCCLEGYTRDEAARHLGCSLATLKRRLEEGRKRLRLRLMHRGLTLPAVLAGVLVSERSSAILAPALVRVISGQAAGIVGAKTAALFPAAAVALADRMVLTMALARLKAWLVIVLAFGSMTAGAGWLVSRATQPIASLSTANMEVSKESLRQAVAQTPKQTPAIKADNVRALAAQPAAGLPEGHVICLAPLSNDGSTLVSPDRWLPLWETAQDSEVRRLGAGRWNGAALVSGSNQSGWPTLIGRQTLHQSARGQSVLVPLAVPMSVETGPVMVRGIQERLAHREQEKIVWWNPARAVALQRTKNHSTPGVLFSPDGRMCVVSGRDGTIVLQEASSGREVRRLVGHHGAITWLIFAADGVSLLSSAADDTLRIWDINRGKQLFCFSIGETPP
jgi:RNA polymerase sigma factor (sigma-70 family)